MPISYNILIYNNMVYLILNKVKSPSACNNWVLPQGLRKSLLDLFYVNIFYTIFIKLFYVENSDTESPNEKLRNLE